MSIMNLCIVSLNCCICFSSMSYLSYERVSEIFKKRTTYQARIVFHDSGQVIPPATTECPIQSDLVDSIVLSSKIAAKHGILTLDEVKC